MRVLFQGNKANPKQLELAENDIKLTIIQQDYF